MALEAFLKSNSQSQIPIILPLNGAGGILEALTNHSSQENEEDLQSILSRAQLNTNFGSNFMNSALLGNSSSSAIGNDAYLQSHGNTVVEPYISLPSYPMPMPFSCDNPVNVYCTDDAFSQLCQARETERKKQYLENTLGSTDIYKRNVQACHDSLPGRIKHESSTLTTTLKKPRVDVKQENIQQEIIQELLLNELQDCNPQLKEMIEQCRQHQLRELQMQIPKQLVNTPCRSLLQGQGIPQEIFAPLLDGGICSRRFKQYLYHLRNNKHDNSISYWKKFMCEYYAPGSKKRWCFSKYENIELHTAGVFCPQSMEIWCCQICGSKSGKGLEATFETFPRLFKIKNESGMVDEILFLDSPRTCKVASGVLLEYGKAIQESVYETFRVVHKGKLRIIFRPDLKILSWEFCIKSHDEFLLRALFTPQVNQLVQAAEKYREIQNRASSKVPSKDLQNVCNMFVSAGTQVLRNMELPLVNDLGYPKRFIRCLQIGEVVDGMRDIMTISKNMRMGPIDCLNTYSQGSKIGNQVNTKQETELFGSPGFHANAFVLSENGLISGSENLGLAFMNSNHHFLGAGRNPTESCMIGHPDRMMVSGQSFSSLLHNEAARQSDRICGTSKEVRYGNSSNGARKAVNGKVTVKEEPCSPEGLLSSASGFSEIQDMGW